MKVGTDLHSDNLSFNPSLILLELSVHLSSLSGGACLY